MNTFITIKTIRLMKLGPSNYLSHSVRAKTKCCRSCDHFGRHIPSSHAAERGSCSLSKRTVGIFFSPSRQDGYIHRYTGTTHTHTHYIYIYIYTHTHIIYIYIYEYTYGHTYINKRVFANGKGDWGSIPCRVIPKTQKNGTWYLFAKHSV